jgi:predicted RNA-binding Zn-ribbon protein involved in translation (DUF1610 family)
MPVGEVKDFEIKVGASCRDCEVKINGETAAVYRTVITADVDDVATTIELHCYGPRHEPIVIKGRMVVDEETIGESPMRAEIARPCPNCDAAISEVTNFHSPNKQYGCLACGYPYHDRA